MTSIIKVAGGNIKHGQVDAAWAIFWLQAEAALAVIVVSISAVQALFVVQRASKQASPAKNTSALSSVWGLRARSRHEPPESPSPSFTGVSTFIHQCPYDEESQNMDIPLQESGIRVTQIISFESVRCKLTSCGGMKADLPQD